MTDAITALDIRILEIIFAVRDPLLLQSFLWITELGRAWFVYAIALCVVLYLAAKRHYALATGLSITMGSAGILTLLLKGFVERARPPIELQAYLETWYSFPSAHAALSVAFYGFIALLVWKLIRSALGRYIALVIISATVVLILLSRVYLGVHYPSDVLAGLALGAACVWLGWKYAKIASNERT